MVELQALDSLHVFLQTEADGVDWTLLVPTIIIAFAAVVSAGSALVSIRLTWRLSEDNRALRKAGTEPEVVAYLGIDRRSAYLVYLVLENVGQGPAVDVEYLADADPQDFAAHNVRKVPARTQRKIASVLPQGESRQRFMEGSTSLLGSDEKPALEPFRVKVSYSNLRGVPMGPKEYLLDVAELGDVVEVVPSDERLANSVEKIQGQLGQFAMGSGRLHVETITTEERESRDEELRARLEQQAAAAKAGEEEAL